MTEDEPLTAGGPFADRLRELLGDDVDPGISLDEDAEGSAHSRESEVSAEILRRLRAHGNKESRYRVKGEVARGGMGAILEVWDEDLRRKLAMKVVLGSDDGRKHPSAIEADPKSLGRFLEEAQITGQLDHPGIVPVHELGLDAAGHVYFTMRLVKGRELREIFEDVHAGVEGWNVTRALGLLLKVCEAMAFAHAKRVIHRDLKPANVMVGRFGEVYVMDWGLARVLGREDSRDIRPRVDTQPSGISLVESDRRGDSSGADDVLYTMDGDVMGTPAYMSPEQAQGRVSELDARTDVYAMGAMLYHLLSGQMPYVPASSRVSPRMILMRSLDGPPVPLGKLAPKCPAELVAICDKAMAREAQDRYSDMQELAEDLRAYLENRVVKAYQTGAIAELSKWVARNRGLAAALASAVVLLAAGLATTLVFKARADANALRADTQARLATDRADDVLRLSAIQDLEDAFAQAVDLWPARPENIDAYEDWIENASSLVADLPLHRARRAELLANALPRTEAERRAERESHSDYAKFREVEGRLAFARRALAKRRDDAVAELPEPDAALYGSNASRLNASAWSRVAPERLTFGEEPLGLALALAAMDRAPDEERPTIGRTLAWAYFALGRDDEALDEMFAAFSEADASSRDDLQGALSELEQAVAEATSENGLAAAESTIERLERERRELDTRIDERREWYFDEREPEGRWWNTQLTKLIAGLEELETELLRDAPDTVSEEHGWSVPRRLAFARELERGFESGGDWARQWDAILPELRAAYPGLVLAIQEGLAPLGPDPDSGLWEFAHLPTGNIPARGADGRLELTEESGLVFVLLPGGEFAMGAQSADPNGANFDPRAPRDEGPVHSVSVAPFFASKYEMTQAQWLRFTGRNPSNYQPPNGQAPTLLHPVEQISWDMCVETCRRLALALPTEAQWEYFARAGTTTPWWTGFERETLIGAANLADQAARREGATWADINEWPELDDGYAVHCPVSAFRANPFGLHNVHGNLWEWCFDGFYPDYYSRSPAVDPVADPYATTNRVRRGGSFGLAAVNARVTVRFDSPPVLTVTNVGVRPVRPLELGR